VSSPSGARSPHFIVLSIRSVECPRSPGRWYTSVTSSSAPGPGQPQKAQGGGEQQMVNRETLSRIVTFPSGTAGCTNVVRTTRARRDVFQLGSASRDQGTRGAPQDHLTRRPGDSFTMDASLDRVRDPTSFSSSRHGRTTYGRSHGANLRIAPCPSSSPGQRHFRAAALTRCQVDATGTIPDCPFVSPPRIAHHQVLTSSATASADCSERSGALRDRVPVAFATPEPPDCHPPARHRRRPCARPARR
jgi:hypothetical protein